MFVVRRLQELARKNGNPLVMCSVDLHKVYDSVDRTLPRTVFAHFGVLPRMLAVFCQFHDGRRACVRLDDVEFSDMFDVNQDLRQGCMLAPLLSNMFYLPEERFTADTDITGSMVQLQRNEEKRKNKRGTALAGQLDKQGKVQEAQTLWAMLYAEEAGIVSRSRNGPKRRRTVPVSACATFGLNVSGAKTVMCLQMNDGENVPFTVTAADQVYK